MAILRRPLANRTSCDAGSVISGPTPSRSGRDIFSLPQGLTNLRRAAPIIHLVPTLSLVVVVALLEEPPPIPGLDLLHNPNANGALASRIGVEELPTVGID